MIEAKMKYFIECHFPTRACNFRCDYCYVTQNKWWAAEKPDLSMMLLKVSDAFSRERLGGVCMVNICATGETLLYEESINVIRSILENGHYVMVVTNGTLTKRFEEICKISENLRKHLFFKISFHYLELKKKNLLETYLKNINLIRESGISFTVELTPDDEYIPYIEEIKSWCLLNLGALCHITVCRDERLKEYPLLSSLPMDEFINTWKEFDSQLFNFKANIFGVKRCEYCYAGKWAFELDLGTGLYKQCYRGKALGNFYDLDKPLNLYAVGNNCQEGHCFNGHAFLGFGLIPGLDTVSYSDMRNRVDINGREWLSPEMKAFMNNRLYEDNVTDTALQKIINNIKSFNIKQRIKKLIKRDKK